ncbi:hypothetical protein [Gracilimonas tropica]|uniref:hypothetical protein n=1 Tax=Gracilimonas tropica TaxID=454600 RepID=UPI0003800B79|nr:hypothetical protein [Gracilimonas tropica]
MTTRQRITKGDVFEVPLKGNIKGYFQYMMIDETQLNSEVIRVFKDKFEMNQTINLEDLQKSKIDFYAHVNIKLGIKMSLWCKIGNLKIPTNLERPRFRDSLDYGNPEVTTSEEWYIWELNKDFEKVGILNDEQKGYDIGIVVTPPDIVEKMNSGKYSFVYPTY